MKNQVTITNTEEFKEVISSLEHSFNKIIEAGRNQIKNANRINETDTWSGKTAKVMYEKYKMLNDNYSHIEYSLELYIKFLKKSLEDYIR